MGALIPMKYGSIEVLGFKRLEGGGVRRAELYHPNDGSRSVNEWSFAASTADTSPRRSTYPTGYDSRCGSCYLGFTHTEDLHAERVAAAQGGK